jgi:hypothetical protein
LVESAPIHEKIVAVNDDELKQVIQAAATSAATKLAAETQQAFEATSAKSAAETQRAFDATSARLAAETQRAFDATSARLAAEMHRASEEAVERLTEHTRHQFDIAATGLRKEVQLVAEAVGHLDEKLDREVHRLDETMTRGFAETQAMIKFSHAELDRRLRALEQVVVDLQTRVERLEETTH